MVAVDPGLVHTTRMRTLVFGAGAVGAYFGGLLARAGEDVTLVARGANLEALRARGLRIESAAGSFALSPRALAHPGEGGGRYDLVLVGVKSYDTVDAAAALRASVDADTIVLSLQNGIENEQILAEVLGLPPLLGALTHIGAELVAPAVVRHDSGGRIIFGEVDGSRSARVERLAQFFDRGRVPYHVSHNIAVMLWDKLSWNAAFNACTAITGRTVRELLAHPDGRALVRAAMAETVTVARAVGVPLDPARIDPVIEHSATELGHLRTSMLQDRERGRRMEHDALNGAVLRAATRAGVDAPVHRVLFALLDAMQGSSPTSPSPVANSGHGGG
jgi:2-dehydropantoate 2-reductase